MDTKKKYSFALEFREKVLDLKWYAFETSEDSYQEFYTKAKALILTN